MDTLAMIDAEETRLLTQLAEVRAAKAVLRRVCGLADPPHGPTGVLPDAPEVFVAPVTARAATAAKEPPPAPPQEPPGKPEPRPSSDESGPKKRGPGVVAFRVARYLTAKGPRRLSEMVGDGVGYQTHISAALRKNPTWFRKMASGLRDPWTLTEAGRAAVTAASSSAS